MRLLAAFEILLVNVRQKAQDTTVMQVVKEEKHVLEFSFLIIALLICSIFSNILPFDAFPDLRHTFAKLFTTVGAITVEVLNSQTIKDSGISLPGISMTPDVVWHIDLSSYPPV